MIGLQIWYII